MSRVNWSNVQWHNNIYMICLGLRHRFVVIRFMKWKLLVCPLLVQATFWVTRSIIDMTIQIITGHQHASEMAQQIWWTCSWLRNFGHYATSVLCEFGSIFALGILNSMCPLSLFDWCQRARVSERNLN